ncbi:MAG: ABC transporter ATP-binding protein [Deltaproteobacteria bacterium]|nr:ABC transporter ATP-binding protein [Deltaproteobacteria bacterium]
MLALLNVTDLKTYFHTRDGITRAVGGISFQINQGETLGIVGESGSGKSVSCYSLLGLVQCPPGRIESGAALFDNMDLLSCTAKELRKIRGNRISMIFQDPMTCLNPYLTIGVQLTESLLVHKNISAREARKRAIDSLVEVGIPDPETRINHYPHQFSGGMRQRVMIAMALITEPRLLIADEPTTALDVTIQAQILDLIKKLQERRNTAVIFITHDLGVIAGVSDRVLVMYAGRIVESGETRPLYYTPAHPYTQSLLDSIPSSHQWGEALYVIPGQPPDNIELIAGCAFAPRCKYVSEQCGISVPELEETGPGHFSACLRVQDGSIRIDPKKRDLS